MGSPSLHLSKTRYLAGLQCPKRLWLSAHARELATPTSPAQQAIFDAGHRVGRRAQELFPGGVLLEDPARRHPEALEETRALLADPRVPAIFEGVFEHAGVRVHVDVLEKRPSNAFGLREVKASTRVKPEHLPDLAVQRFVLEGAGLPVDSVELVHVNPEYVRGAAGIDPGALFRRVDLASALAPASADVPRRVAEQHAVLAQGEAPEVEPGPRCMQPYACEFWAHCTRGKPLDWVFHLPRIGGRFEELRAAGVERMADIPPDFSLTKAQARIREAHRSGDAFVSPGLGDALRPLGPPTLHLDFEVLSAGEPLYAGTRPYQSIPFQWSLHAVDENGSSTHRAFLADGRDDPRREFAESLLEATGATDAPILVWSNYEAGVLRRLSDALPSLRSELLALASRLVDLLALVREHVYQPAFGGSYSIKDVAPALAPGFGWSDLAESTGIADGGAAAAAFEAVARDPLAGETEKRIRAALHAYCARDTEAMVRVHAALRQLAALPASQ